MESYRLLFQIKTLEQLIFRSFLHDKKCSFQGKKDIPTPTQMQIIEYILKNPHQEIYQKDLEKILNLRRATVSGVLQTMEKNHLLKRISDSQDARTKKIILDANTKQLFIEQEKLMEELEKIVIQGISQKDLETFSSVLGKMKENIRIQGSHKGKRDLDVRKDDKK